MRDPRLSGVPAPAPHELPRERLLEVLHRHSTRPLLLLVAPAGFGKSTLAAGYARDSGAAVAWLTLHPGDRDSRAFFSRVAEALEVAFNASGDAASDQTPLAALRRGLLEGAEGLGLARLLLADLVRAPEGFVLVLDDFHTVQDQDEVVQSVDALVRGLPEMGQIVITAREMPPLAITGLVAGDAVFALGTEDLRFTDEETARLRRALGGDASRDAQAEGWVAGILLGGAPRQLGALGGTLLGAYVEREVLARLEATEQRWLESCAVLETVTATAARRLLGDGPWGPRLAALTARCPFLVATGDGGYRLHALVRDALLNRLRRGDADQLAQAWSVARELAEEAYDTVGVVRACQELGRADEAVGIVRRSVEEGIQTGRWAATLATLELLPEPVRRAYPELALAEAQALVQMGRPEPAEQAAEAALHHGGRSGEVCVQVSAILELANIARYKGDTDAALDWVSAADHLLRDPSLARSQQRLLEGRALTLRGVCQAVRGQSGEARRTLESAERILQATGTSRELAMAQQNLGTLCARTGDYGSAQALLAAAATTWRVIGDRTTLANNQLLLGNLALRTGDLETAGRTLSNAIEAARAIGALRIETATLASLGDWHRANGRIGDAAQAFDESASLASEIGERELLVEALRLRAEVAVVQDDLGRARQFLAQAQAEGQRLGSDFQLAGVERALGRMHLAEGAGQRALTHLEAAVQRGASVWGPFERTGALYWLGTAHHVLGRAQPAAEALREALALAMSAGGAATLAVPAAEDSRLLRYGLQIGLDEVLLRDVERLVMLRQPWAGARALAPVELVARNDLPRLEARLFGSFVLYRDGEMVEPGVRKVDRARELLAVLILHPAGVPDRQIGEMLWPHMAPQRALHNLQMAAYALRRLLGSKAAVRYAASSYQLAPHMEVWADVRAFDAALTRARVTTGAAAVSALREAVDIVRGPLLADAGWEWAESLRLNYQARFCGAALRLAELVAPTDGAGSDALAEHVLTLEPDNETAYERLVQNAEQRADTGALRRVLHRYQEAAQRLQFSPNPLLLRRYHKA